MLQKIRFFDKKRPKTIVIVIIVRMTIFKSIHMIFYVNPSWTCALFINNKQHVGRERSTRGRRRTLTDSEIQRNRSGVSSKWNKCRIYVGDQLDSCRWMERTQGSATRQISRWSGKDFAWLLLMGKPTIFSQSFFIFYEFMMMPMIIFGRYYSIYVILHLATANYCQWVA